MADTYLQRFEWVRVEFCVLPTFYQEPAGVQAVVDKIRARAEIPDLENESSGVLRAGVESKLVRRGRLPLGVLFSFNELIIEAGGQYQS